ncbi:MAG: tRNA lysidine(34) synthetase TilS [Candidatus Kapaibacterium sp.]
MTGIRSAFTAALDRFDLDNQTVLVAVSGGVDSTTLLHLLCDARTARNLTVHVAHVDHTLREESGNDAAFVEQLALAAKAPFHSCRVDVRGYAAKHGCGIEAAARHLRYAFLEESAKLIGAGTVLTGHTADDVIETVLMHLARGGSVQALAGIPRERPISDDVRVVRPLLEVSRAEIEGYALENELKWVIDASNINTVHLRNRVRHELMSVMRSVLGPGVGTNILRFARLMGEVAPLIESMADNIQDRCLTRHGQAVRLQLDILSSQPRVVIDHLLQKALGLGHVDRDRLFGLVDADVGTAASLSGGRMGTRDRGFITVADAEQTPSDGSDGSEVAVSIADGAYGAGARILQVQLVEGPSPHSLVTTGHSVSIDVDKIVGPLKFRPWHTGDRIHLHGVSGSKLVSDVLTDAKVDHGTRGSVRVLADEQGILWICGVRQSDRARCSDDTVRYLHCRME